MYVCMFVYLHVYMYACLCKPTRTCTMYICARVHIGMYDTHACLYVYAMCVHVLYIHTHVHACACTCMLCVKVYTPTSGMLNQLIKSVTL